MAIDLSRSERGMRKGFLEQGAFVVIDIVLLLLTLGLLIKSLGLVFNPDKQIVTFNTEFLKSKIDYACQHPNEMSSLSKFAFPQPTPSKLLGASDFLAQFSIAGSKSADPHYVLYYEAFPVGEAVGWEVYHSNFDSRIVVPFYYTNFSEKFTENGKPKIGKYITGDDVKGFFEEMKDYTNTIEIEAATKGIELKKTKKPILFNNIILSGSLNVLPQETPTPPTKDISSFVSGEGNAGKWMTLGSNDRKFEFSDYLGLSDEERTYLKYRPCGDNSLCLKTRDGVEAIQLSEACRGKYFQLFYDARGDADSYIYTALFGKQAKKVAQHQLDNARNAEIAAQQAEEAAKNAADELAKLGPDAQARAIAAIEDLAKDADDAAKAGVKAVIENANMESAKIAELKLAQADIVKLQDDLRRKTIDDLSKLKLNKIPEEIAERTNQLVRSSVLSHAKVKSFAIAEEAAKRMKALRAAIRYAGEAAEKSKKMGAKAINVYKTGVKWVCGAAGIVPLGKGICKGIFYGGPAIAVGTAIALKGTEFAKSMISFSLSFKVSDFYLASPCSLEGEMEIKSETDCSMRSNANPPVCARLQKFPLYKYDDSLGSRRIEYRGDHWTCMDSIGNNYDIPQPEQDVGCIRLTIKEQKDGFCFTKNPYLVRKNTLLFEGTAGTVTKYGVKTLSTAVNGFVDWFAPIWVSIPAQAAGVEVPGGFNIDDLTALVASSGLLPVKELSEYLPSSKAVVLAPGELAEGVAERIGEIAENAVGLSWTWPS